MSKIIIAAKIDVTKVDKSKLFAGKNGAKYLDVILVETPDSKYGDNFMVTQSVSKEERERGVKGAILGNAKYLGRGQAPQRETATTADNTTNTDDDVPF